jgi:hypothetical protein
VNPELLWFVLRPRCRGGRAEDFDPGAFAGGGGAGHVRGSRRGQLTCPAGSPQAATYCSNCPVVMTRLRMGASELTWCQCGIPRGSSTKLPGATVNTWSPQWTLSCPD